MRALPIASPGALGELFWLLAHPTSATLSVLALSLTLLSGEGFDSVWSQALALLTFFTATAQLSTSRGAQLKRQALWLGGALSLMIGLTLTIQGEGEASLPEGGRVESYMRGEEVKVAHHLGNPLSLTRAASAPEFTLSLGGTVNTKLSEQALLSGERFDLGAWSAHLTHVSQDVERPRALIKLKERAGEATQTLWLRPGQRLSPNGQLSITAYDVTGRFTSRHIKDLGGAADLELEWRPIQGESAGVTRKERAWHFVDMPQLSERVGDSPWVAEVLKIEATPVYHLRVTERASPLAMMWLLLALGLWAVALITRLIASEPLSDLSTPH